MLKADSLARERPFWSIFILLLGLVGQLRYCLPVQQVRTDSLAALETLDALSMS